MTFKTHMKPYLTTLLAQLIPHRFSRSQNYPPLDQTFNNFTIELPTSKSIDSSRMKSWDFITAKSAERTTVREHFERIRKSKSSFGLGTSKSNKESLRNNFSFFQEVFEPNSGVFENRTLSVYSLQMKRWDFIKAKSAERTAVREHFERISEPKSSFGVSIVLSTFGSKAYKTHRKWDKFFPKKMLYRKSFQWSQMEIIAKWPKECLLMQRILRNRALQSLMMRFYVIMTQNHQQRNN
jgi:hypothetical protein